MNGTTNGVNGTLVTTRKRQPTGRVGSKRQDVWTIINEGVMKAPIKPINMGQGFHSYPPPDFMITAAKDAMDLTSSHQYSPPKGAPRLRKAIAKAYSPFFGKAIDPETEVLVTTGANEGTLAAILAFVEPGDEVVLFEPFFDQYISNIDWAGGKCVYVPISPPKDGATRNTSSSEWLVDFDRLEEVVSAKTKLLIVNSPNNPNGKVMTREELHRIADLCVKHNVIVISDEVYDRLNYVPFTRISTLSPEIARLTLSVGSAGKNFYCTGWRIGWFIGPADLIKYVGIAHMRICFCSPSPLQEAVAVGFEKAEQLGFWDQTVSDMRSKVDRFVKVFDELGMPYSYPDGGYFVMANLSKVRLPEEYEYPPQVAERTRDFKLAWFVMYEVGVAAIPPSEFYSSERAHLAQDYLRFSVCKTESELDEAQKRLRLLKKYMV
ncbi:kynurenine aminotransferase [Coniochaeta sp. 2T2.1]|nr:kynurenine aminotransferase [Coniochaeta sp. 2T2.1]